MNTPELPTYKPLGINRFAPHQTLKDIAVVQRRWESRLSYFQKKLSELRREGFTSDDAFNYATNTLNKEIEKCKHKLNTELPNRNTIMLQLNNPTRSLPKKKQREMGLLPKLL